jgi:methionine synthase II (cobalamin-independent)
VILQVDEPSLPGVLAARVPTASGFATLRAVQPGIARDALALVVDAAGGPVVVHCCARDVPLALIHSAGATAVAVDLGVYGRTAADLDALGESIEAGLGLWAGVVPSTDTDLSGPGDTVSAVRTLWRQLGFAPERLAQVVLTPACGLAGASPAYARAAQQRLRSAARTLVDYPEG